MSGAQIRLWPELPKARIHPNIYGHFAEHLGRCIYEGLWAGPKSRIPNEQGIRLDVLAALKHLRIPVLRWPGGCFADDYHWRNGIGSNRPGTVNIWWQQGEPNEFGTDEFMRFCQVSGCAPYICCNVGSGTPQEAREWLEYCNFGGDTTLTQQRAANGNPAPYEVKYWGVGNENWGCGGRFRPQDYAKEYVRFAAYLKALDSRIELAACGTHFGDYKNPVLNAWNHDFCQEMVHADLIDHIALHRYFNRGKGTTFSDGEFQALFADVVTLEKDLELTEAVLTYFYPDKFVGIIVDEWGMWHPEATVDNGLEQDHTLRDALLAGAVLNCFNRWAHRVTMANIAQTINVLQCMAMTDGAKMFLTPTYHVFEMMRPHMGAELLTQAVECPSFEAHPIGLNNKHTVPLLSVSASRTGGKILLSVVNQSLTNDIETSIRLSEGKIETASGRILTAKDPREHNTFKNPKAVEPRRIKTEPVKGELTHVFPRHSLTVLSLNLE
ncbi:MAG TPA: alpha-L-arabinofuranosidase C-terminal domain-containing protein [Candidatus Hydrogenedentes bacterium]|nr:alpha-L-arabinofuranosidase C-terminal domain-containing protein [Candidatus Hydrogenedentota bacterium]